MCGAPCRTRGIRPVRVDVKASYAYELRTAPSDEPGLCELLRRLDPVLLCLAMRHPEAMGTNDGNGRRRKALREAQEAMMRAVCQSRTTDAEGCRAYDLSCAPECLPSLTAPFARHPDTPRLNLRVLTLQLRHDLWHPEIIDDQKAGQALADSIAQSISRSPGLGAIDAIECFGTGLWPPTPQNSPRVAALATGFTRGIMRCTTDRTNIAITACCCPGFAAGVLTEFLRTSDGKRRLVIATGYDFLDGGGRLSGPAFAPDFMDPLIEALDAAKPLSTPPNVHITIERQQSAYAVSSETYAVVTSRLWASALAARAAGVVRIIAG